MSEPGPRGPYVVVASLVKRDPMCALFFTHLANRVPLRIVQYGADNVALPLSGASALIVIRGLFEFGNLAATARWLGIPVYYFLDDNFMLIRDEEDEGGLYRRYSIDAVRQTLKGYTGVLLAAESLVDYFRAHRLHESLDYYPPVAGPVFAAARAPNHPLTIAFFGGQHRREPFARYVYPAVRRLASTCKVRLVAAGIQADSLDADPNLEIVFPPYDTSYTAAMREVAKYGIDILVHPSGVSENNVYKNPHVLINARSLGAAPVFSDAAPYASLAGSPAAVVCQNSVDAWFAALEELSDRERRRRMVEALDVYCQAEFAGDVNAKLIGALLTRHARPGHGVRALRWFAGSVRLGFGHAATRLSTRLDTRVLPRWLARKGRLQ